ncbi:hypothetical protein KAS08_03560 [Candidatus Pacearchaeota archaeon]|nr:hypothetical protein [Candidatus Pacearchaeota archaeon]
MCRKTGVGNKKLREISKKDIPKLKYGVVHSQVGFSDGVSIVMEQVENVMRENLKVPKENIFYLVGKTSKKELRITEDEVLWDRHKVNRKMLGNFESGYGGHLSERIEASILKAKIRIENWVKENKIDILIVHNSSHPVNFISSVALSRYYRDAIARGRKTPKYILWWHDSHLEREHFSRPSNDVRKYLLEGVPGRFVEYIIFINNLQLRSVKKYFLEIDKKYKGFYKKILSNHNVAYNTTGTFINSFRDIDAMDNGTRVKRFIRDFDIKGFLGREGLRLKDTLFCLQHTRIVERKRIDFALKYCYELLEKSKKKALYFLVSGQADVTGAKYKRELIKLNKKLAKETGKRVFLIFAEDYYDKTKLSFDEYPRIFARLGGFSTYFSEVEGFGNNLLEVLASGLIPVVYKYPVFKKDIEKFNFSLLALDKFEVEDDVLSETLKFLASKKLRHKMVDNNLEILKEYFPHKIIASKLERAIIKKR